MKLSVYLIREGVSSFDSVMLDRCLEGEQPYEAVDPRPTVGFECVAYVQASKEKPPKWLDFLKVGFNLDSYTMVNTTNSFVLFVKSKDRIFAFAFGYGYSAIDKSLIESGFGLRVTLNSISASGLDTVDTRNIDLVTRQTRTHISLASPLYEFGINTTMDWIRYASGKPSDEETATRYSGSDSLQVSFEDLSIITLDSICEELLEKWNSNAYKSRFPFVDDLIKVSKEIELWNVLGSELKKKLINRSYDKISLAHPDIPNPEIESYKIWKGREKQSIIELELAELYSFMDILDSKPEESMYNIDDISIIGLDSEENAKTQKRNIIDYIVCEVDYEGKRYIHSLNEWFEVSDRYFNEIKEKIRLIDISQTSSPLPKIKTGEAEGDYNERVALAKDYLLLDKKAFTFEGYRNRIEACDLATKKGELIAVKKMSSSATLSHLFAQGSVSAKLLRLDNRYQQKLLAVMKDKWHDLNLKTDDFSFIYAIPSKKKGALSETMFFFSMVNFIDHAENITLAGFKVYIKKIEYD